MESFCEDYLSERNAAKQRLQEHAGQMSQEHRTTALRRNLPGSHFQPASRFVELRLSNKDGYQDRNISSPARGGDMKTIMVWFFVLLCTLNMLAYLISMAAPFVGPVVVPYVKPLWQSAQTYVKPLWQSAEKAMPWAKTPEAIAAEVAAQEREVAANAKKEALLQKVVLAANATKRSVRDPKSLTWDAITANDDATVICLAYRASNGRGGLKKEAVVQVNGKTSRGAAAWSKHCTKTQLNDMSYVITTPN